MSETSSLVSDDSDDGLRGEEIPFFGAPAEASSPSSSPAAAAPEGAGRWWSMLDATTRWPSLRYATLLVVAVVLGVAARRRGPAAAGDRAPDEALASSPEAAAAGASPEMPHILHVVLDDVGWNDLWESSDLAPSVVSPTITRLAKEGVKLTSYYGQSYCTVARAALLTGKFVHRLGFAHDETSAWGPLEVVGDANYSVPLGHALVPEHLGRLGYATHGVGKWNVGHCAVEYLPWKRGFDTFLGYFSDGVHYTTHAVDEYGGGVIGVDEVPGIDESHTVADLVSYDGDDANFAWDGGLAFLGRHTTEIFTREAAKRIRRAARPTYVWLAYHGAHDNEGALEGLDIDEGAFAAIDATLAPERAAFARNVRAIDDGLFALKNALVATGRDFLVALHSDNGGFPCAQYLCSSNYPLRGAKFDFMEGALRVPALVYSPTLLGPTAAGTAYTHLFHHVDWLATFLGVATRARTPGDVADTLLGDGAYDSLDQWPALSEKRPRGPRTRILFSVSAGGLVIRDGDFKLIADYGGADWFPPDLNTSDFTREVAKHVCFQGDAPTTFLFNVRDDPEERVNLYDDPDHANVLADLLDAGARAYDDEAFDYPLARAWIFKEATDPEAVRLRATWIDTSDDDVYRFIAPWGCMLVYDDGALEPGTTAVPDRRGRDPPQTESAG